MAKRRVSKRNQYIVLNKLQSADVAAALAALIRRVLTNPAAAGDVDMGRNALQIIWNAPPLPPIGQEPKQ